MLYIIYAVNVYLTSSPYEQLDKCKIACQSAGAAYGGMGEFFGQHLEFPLLLDMRKEDPGTGAVEPRSTSSNRIPVLINSELRNSFCAAS